MKQNIYDNLDFFDGYRRMRDNNSGLNEVLEEPAIRSLLPSLRDKSILDLGCGFGSFETFALEQGAANVLAIDISEKMLALARERVRDERVNFICQALEDFVPENGSYDLAISSLCLHYLQEVEVPFRRIASALKPGGQFIFSIEHPMCTALLEGWEKDEHGVKRHWRLDRYFEEGRRVTRWFVDGVIKYHRTIETYLRATMNAGLETTALVEPRPARQQLADRPDLEDEMRRPAFLIIAGRLRE